jgi:hypothetical protein
MRLERHVGGLGRARKVQYLEARGWTCVGGEWLGPTEAADPVKLDKALHHQLTRDLSAALAVHGFRVLGYSPRGYVQLEDTATQETCSLPKALRLQARREQRPVRELTYAMFLAAMLAT